MDGQVLLLCQLWVLAKTMKSKPEQIFSGDCLHSSTIRSWFSSETPRFHASFFVQHNLFSQNFSPFRTLEFYMAPSISFTKLSWTFFPTRTLRKQCIWSPFFKWIILLHAKFLHLTHKKQLDKVRGHDDAKLRWLTLYTKLGFPYARNED